MDVPWQEKHVEFLPLCFWVWLSEEQQNLATNWSGFFVAQQPFKIIQHQSKGREVRDFESDVGVCNLQWMEDVHSTVRNVGDREQAFRQWTCKNRAVKFCFKSSFFCIPRTPSIIIHNL